MRRHWRRVALLLSVSVTVPSNSTDTAVLISRAMVLEKLCNEVTDCHENTTTNSLSCC